MTGSTPKVALVTGGSRGIGAAICRRLGRDGLAVHLLYRSSHDRAAAVRDEIMAGGGRCVLHPADVAVESELQRAVDEVIAAEDALHVLVNNAAITDDRLAMATATDRWEHVLRVNLTSAFLASRAVLPAMVDQGWGRIVNVSSASVRTPGPGQTAYAAAKGGLEALTRALAAEVGRKGIRVNAVAPGTVRTEMTDPVADRLVSSDDADPRWGLPQDISGVVAFLASDEADYIQGQTITVDGGRSTRRGRA